MCNGKREDKAWCSNHKWCSKHHKYESAGKCEYSNQIAAKVSPKHTSQHPQRNTPPTFSKSHPLVAVGGDIGENFRYYFFLDLILTL
jgi:hypothetical protein